MKQSGRMAKRLALASGAVNSLRPEAKADWKTIRAGVFTGSTSRS